MARFLIEVPHEADRESCVGAVHVFLETGSHWLTHADWGCLDGVHKAWITVDVDSKEEALRIVPPAFRSRAEIVKLNEFSMEDLDEIMRHHEG